MSVSRFIPWPSRAGPRGAYGGGWSWANAVAVATLAALHLAGVTAGLDRWLMDGRFEVLSRPASGELAVVEIDPRSLRALDVWPWPRELHARVIDGLLDAGALEVAVDVDFSARSRPTQDAALAAALERSGGRVILPGYRQVARLGGDGTETVDTAPHPLFRPHVQLGGVTMAPDANGMVRWAGTTETRAHAALPTVPALLAGPSSLDVGRFLIDFGIQPETLPRHSFVDVLRGRVPDAAFAGRRVIVGAAAAELGDQHSVPVHRALHGPVLEALAYESLVQDRALRPAGAPLVIGGAGLLLLVLGPWFQRRSWPRRLLAAGLAIALLEAIAMAVQAAWPIVLLNATWILAVLAAFLISTLREIEVQALQLFRQRMSMTHRRAVLSRVLDDSFDGIAITDSRGAIEDLNRSAARMLDLDPSDARGRPLREVLPEVAALVDAVTADPDAAVDAPVGPRELRLAGRGDDPLTVEVVVGRSVVRPSRDPRERRSRARTVFSFTFRDVTARANLAAAHGKAAREAEAASRAKSQFLANMSHELRTPLNAIIGFSELMTSRALGPMQPPQYEGYVRDIEQSGRHLLAVINDILDVAKIESGNFELRDDTVDLAKLLDACTRIAMGWNGVRERDLRVDSSAGAPRVVVDQRLIKQSVINLLSNAVKYSAPGDRIDVRARATADGGVAIEVADTGPGIAPEHLADIAKPFYQADGSLSRRNEGTGLGLSLVSAYLEAHGGRMEIDSVPGRGTTVRLLLPASRAVAGTTATPPAIWDAPPAAE